MNTISYSCISAPIFFYSPKKKKINNQAFSLHFFQASKQIQTPKWTQCQLCSATSQLRETWFRGDHSIEKSIPFQETENIAVASEVERSPVASSTNLNVQGRAYTCIRSEVAWNRCQPPNDTVVPGNSESERLPRRKKTSACEEFRYSGAHGTWTNRNLRALAILLFQQNLVGPWSTEFSGFWGFQWLTDTVNRWLLTGKLT